MKASILLAEDNEANRKLYENSLREFDFTVITCADLNTAQKAVHDIENVDGMWMDINLQGPPLDYANTAVIDGLDLIREVRSHAKEIPAVVCSAYITEEAREKAHRLQVDDSIAGWYSKPCDAEVIGFDMIRAVNISFWKREIVPEIERDLSNISGDLDFRRNFLRTSTPYKLFFPHDRQSFKKRLVSKLAELFERVETRSRKEELEDAQRSQSDAFRLAANHLPACFEISNPCHQALTEHLIFIAASFQGRSIQADAARELKVATEMLHDANLTESAVFELKVSINKSLGVRVGPLSGNTRAEVMQYFFRSTSKD
jgi:CheY-like chemotaxis protein